MRDRVEKGDIWGSKMLRAEEVRILVERGRGSEVVIGVGRLVLDGRVYFFFIVWGRRCRRSWVLMFSRSGS